jgi:hypothetical protein
MKNPFDMELLEPNWDGYHSPPIPHEVCEKISQIGKALEPILGEPQYVPCADSSAQVEWHEMGWDVECWVSQYIPVKEQE